MPTPNGESSTHVGVDVVTRENVVAYQAHWRRVRTSHGYESAERTRTPVRNGPLSGRLREARSF
ncbi:MAG TPA: hypothetical protein VGQ10_08585 [Vicinamibacterales bacterium]|nr:hypothetical protein [Vicinamibacterales bacterium]